MEPGGATGLVSRASSGRLGGALRPSPSILGLTLSLDRSAGGRVAACGSARDELSKGGGRRRVTRAAAADHAVDDDHADAGQIAHPDALQKRVAGGVLGPVP